MKQNKPKLEEICAYARSRGYKVYLQEDGTIKYEDDCYYNSTRGHATRILTAREFLRYNRFMHLGFSDIDGRPVQFNDKNRENRKLRAEKRTLISRVIRGLDTD